MESEMDRIAPIYRRVYAAGIALAVVILLAVSSCKAADSYRLKVENDGKTEWGNCLPVSSDCVLTCAHCVEDGQPLVEIAGKWVGGDVLSSDKDNDLALVRVKGQEFKPAELIIFPLMVKAAGGEVHKDGTAEFSQIKSNVAAPDRITLHFPGMALGMSGSPVMVSGRVVGMIVSAGGLECDDGEGHKKFQVTSMTAVSTTVIRAFLDKSGVGDVEK